MVTKPPLPPLLAEEDKGNKEDEGGLKEVKDVEESERMEGNNETKQEEEMEEGI
jgi:hypothetical protein